ECHRRSVISWSSFLSSLRRPYEVSELEAERIRPSIVVVGQAGWRLAVVVLEEAHADVPVAGQVEVEVERVVDSIAVVDGQAGVIVESRHEVGDLQLLGHDLRADVRLSRVLRLDRRIRVVLSGTRQPAPDGQVLRRGTKQVSPAATATRRAKVEALLVAVQEVLRGVRIPAVAEEIPEVVAEIPAL